jgi:membrane protein implicated in regulation of membrane protease activity
MAHMNSLNEIGNSLANIPPSAIWLICGAFLIILDVIMINVIWVMFAGLGAVTVGAMVASGFIDSTVAQFTLFFFATGIWSLLLWKPLKNFMEGKGTGFNDMVGATAIVYGEALEYGKMGKVKWSGTVMNCRLESNVEGVNKIEPGTEVTIAGVSKGVMLVRTKKPDMDIG